MEEKGEENKAAPRECVADGPRDGTQTRLLTTRLASAPQLLRASTVLHN